MTSKEILNSMDYKLKLLSKDVSIVVEKVTKVEERFEKETVNIHEFNALKNDVEKMEQSQVWLTRAVIGSIISAIMAAFYSGLGA